MKHQVLTDPLTPQELEEQAGDLLQIATVDPKRMATGRALRSELRKVGRDSIIVSMLLRMLFNRDWDRIFHIVDDRVLLRFPQGDLLDPANGVIYFLSRYNTWQSARIALAMRGLDDTVEVGGPRKQKPAVSNALQTIGELRGEAGPNGDSLDNIFSAWSRRCARVEPILLTIGTVDGSGTVDVEIPAKAQLGAPLPLQPGGNGNVHEHPERRIKFVRRYWLIRTTSGRLLLIPKEMAAEGVPLGSSISYSRKAATPVRAWCMLDKGVRLNTPVSHEEM